MSQTDNGFLKMSVFFDSRTPSVAKSSATEDLHSTVYKRQKLGTRVNCRTGVNWFERDQASGEQAVRTFKVDGQAVKSVALAIAFETGASFQRTGDLDDGARSEEKKNSRFPRLLEERSTLT